MTSRYEIFCHVIQSGSFTRTAAEMGYSQSAVSQAVKTLEAELDAQLLRRHKDGVTLTPDGGQYLPYIQSIVRAEQSLRQKRQEMAGLENSTVRLGTFTSVSRTLLPPAMQRFQRMYPGVSFMLRQGDYTNIQQWIRDGQVDFGFLDAAAAEGLHTAALYEDEMSAVLPQNHPLSGRERLTLRQLSREPLILLDEGKRSVALSAFHRAGCTPRVAYEVYDDYTILAMVRQGLGVSLMYSSVLEGMTAGLAVRPLSDPPRRTVALAWQEEGTLPRAARTFLNFLLRGR